MANPPSSASDKKFPSASDWLERLPIASQRLPLVLAGLALFISLLVTAMVWHNAKDVAYDKLQAEFELRVRETVEDINHRMQVYEQVLRGTRGFLQASMEVKRDEFRTYVAALRLEEYYPGIQGIGLAEIVAPAKLDEHVSGMWRQGFPHYQIFPATERAFYTAASQIEPMNDANQRALGFDMYSEPVRRAAMEHARATGRPSLSGKVQLKQELRNDGPPGFIMYFPVYRQDMPLATEEERLAASMGWVYAAFRLQAFLSGLGGERSTDLHLSIYDGDKVDAEACMLGCTQTDPGNSLLSMTRQVLVTDHPWTLRVRSSPAFEVQLDQDKPMLIATGGLVLSILLALFVGVLASSRSRALATARHMTRELHTSHRHIALDKERIERILESSHDAFIALDDQGLVTDWNLEAERLFGWPARKALGRKLEHLIIPEALHAGSGVGFDAFAQDGQGRRSNRRVEAQAQHQDGTLIPIELAVASLETEKGLGAHAFIRDLREQKEQEQREAQHQKSLEETRIALQHAQRMEAVGKLTGGVAHDFNNVLQIITGNIQLLQVEDASPEQQAERLDNALSAVERGSRLSNQLLAFARRQPLQPLVINLRHLMTKMDDLLRHALGESIDVETVIGGGLWNTLVDPHQLENVILNLAINACDAMQGQGKLTIELANALLDDEYVLSQPDVPAGQYVVLALSDTGSGMSARVLERVFEPFFSTKPEGEGTGLGLSMAYGFVKQSEGHIRIYSEPGHGTTVRIYLPRSTDKEMEIPSISYENAVGGTETILIVEDDLAVQITVGALLRKLGYRVLQASDAASALDIVQRGEAIDLLFTDVVMPGPIRSPELARQAKALLPELAVLFTSGYTQNAIVHGGRLDPGVELLSKPYRREQLARKVRQLLEQRTGNKVSTVPAPSIPSGSAQRRRILVVEANADLCVMACELLSLLGHQADGVQSGAEALLHAQEHVVEVLFTELSLPDMEGRELARAMQQIQSGVQVMYAFNQGLTLTQVEMPEAVILKKPYHFDHLRRALEQVGKGFPTH